MSLTWNKMSASDQSGEDVSTYQAYYTQLVSILAVRARESWLRIYLKEDPRC